MTMFARTMEWPVSAIVALCIGLYGADAKAADASSSAAAQALFDEARKLVTAQNYAAACPKFAESLKLDPGGGTQLHLGNCYEKLGKTASAWATYIDATGTAKAQGRSDWADNAKKRAAALEPKLARITVSVAKREPGLEVRRGDVAVAEASFGSAIPVDPGEHTFEATAPKKKKWRSSVTVKEGARIEVSVPTLAVDAEAVEAEALAHKTGNPDTKPLAFQNAHASAPTGGGGRTVGFVLAGVGAAGLGVGAVTGVMAMSRSNRSKELCPTDGACKVPEAIDANSNARTLGTISTVSFIAGGALALTGMVLIVTGGSKSDPKVGLRLQPTVAFAGREAAFGLTGVFQ
jgi:hypothetical protein